MCEPNRVSIYLCIVSFFALFLFVVFSSLLSSTKRNGWFGVLVFWLCFCAHECDLIFMLLQFLLAGGCCCCCFLYFSSILSFGMSLFLFSYKRKTEYVFIAGCALLLFLRISEHQVAYVQRIGGLVFARCILEICNELNFWRSCLFMFGERLNDLIFFQAYCLFFPFFFRNVD